MKLAKKEKSSVDMLFLLALFGVFVLCSLFIVLFGAKIYQKTVNNMEQNFTNRTVVSYITEKIHQHDGTDRVCILSLDGISVLRLEEASTETRYYTYLYFDENALKEITLSESSEFHKEDGTEVLSLLSFDMQKLSPSLYSFGATDQDMNLIRFSVHVNSDCEKEESGHE